MCIRDRVIAEKKLLRIRKETLIAGVLVMCIATLLPVYLVVNHSQNIGTLYYTDLEHKMDKISSGRYLIWKECIINQNNSLIFGEGNLKLEQEERIQYINDHEDIYWGYVSSSQLGPHNGYIGMISATGWAGFGLFIAILLQRIKRAKHLEKGRWYLMLIFIFVINCFESLFVLNRFFTCFYMFLILETDMEDGEDRLTEEK